MPNTIGDPPVPRGTDGASQQAVDAGRNVRAAIPSGESPDGTGESPVPPTDCEIPGLEPV